MSAVPGISGAAPVRTMYAAYDAMTQTAKIARTGIQWACLCSRRPMRAVSRNPAIGRTSSSGSSWSMRHRRIASYSSTSGVFLLR